MDNNTSRKILHVIKKYPNRRLYDTYSSSYITLSKIRQFILDGQELKVLDSKTNEDLTHSILLQVILDKENSNPTLLSNDILIKIIKFYNHPLQRILRSYLEKNIQFFIEAQQEIAKPLSLITQQSTQPTHQRISLFEKILSQYLAESHGLLAKMQIALEKEAEPGVQVPTDEVSA